MDGWSFVKVRLLTNFAPPLASGDRSGAAPGTDPPSIWSRCGRLGGDTGGNEGNAAFEKAWQNFYEKGGYGYSLCKSDCAPILLRPSPQEIVLGRLTGSSAVYLERLRDIVLGERGTVGFFCVRSALSKPLLYSIKVFGRGRGGDFFSKKVSPA